MKYITINSCIVLFLTLIPLGVKGQFTENFSDGDFSSNPTWNGDESQFVIDGGELRLSSSGSDESYLATPNTLATCTTWEFNVRLGFNPTSGNKAYVYLMADQENLESTTLQGYYILIGNTKDEISLYRQDGNTATMIIDGEDDAVDASSVNVRVKVTRDLNGNWALFYDTAGGTNFTAGGTAFDNTYTTTRYFGFLCDYTSSNASKFYFDNISLTAQLCVQTTAVENANSILITFNQEPETLSAEEVSNYSIDNGIDVISATVTGNQVVLNTSPLSTNDYQLTLSNLKDAFQSTINSPILIELSYLQLALESVSTISSTHLQLTFNDEVNSANAEQLSNYTVDNGIGLPNSATVDTDNNRIIHLFFDSPFQPLTTYALSYGNLQNSIGNSEITDATEGFEYIVPLEVIETLVVSKNEIILRFNLKIEQTSAETLTNYLIDEGIGNPTSAILDESDSKSVRLLFDHAFQETDYTLTLNGLKDTGNHEIPPNSTTTFSYLPLTVQAIEVINTKTLEVTFNQPVGLVSAGEADNYVVNYAINSPHTASRDAADSQKVLLVFEKEFANNTYTLLFNGIANTSQNATTENLEVSFVVETNTSFRSIVINEIFADPTPQVGLPGEEYVELYNASDKAIDLGSFSLSGGDIPQHVLLPGNYAILTATTDAPLFESYGDVLGVASWNTLTNGGEKLELIDNLGNLVDSVTYSDNWHEPEKDAGGWSLEQINPNLPCNYHSNWASSSHATGGTPGSVNSVFNDTPDTSPPKLAEAKAISETLLQLRFNEPMDQTSLSAAGYSVSSASSTIVATPESTSTFGALLRLHPQLISGNFYTITATETKDCSGNTNQSTAFDFFYDIEPPKLQRIQLYSDTRINLYFDEPLAKAHAEKEENYLLNTQLANKANLDSENPQKVIVTPETALQLAASYTLTLENISDTLGNVLSESITTPFVFEQHIDTVRVTSINQLELVFTQPVNAESALNTSHYTIGETMESPAFVYPDENDPLLFHLLYEKNLESNKELRLTAENILDPDGDFLTTPQYTFIYDTRSPKIDSLTVSSSNTLMIHFNERVQKNSAESIENYHYNGIFPDSSTLSVGDSSVLLSFREAFETEEAYELTVENIKDLPGNSMTSRTKLPFIFDTSPPKLDSVFVFSPHQLMVVFHEEIVPQPGTFTLDMDIGSAHSFTIDKESGREVLLTFGQPFPLETTLTLSIDQIADTRGNTLATPLMARVSSAPFHLSQIRALAAHSVELTFNQIPKDIHALPPSSFVVNDTYTPGSVSIKNDRTVLLSFDQNWTEKATNTLKINGVINEMEQPLSIKEYSFRFNSRFSTLHLLNDNTLELTWEVALKKEAFPGTHAFTLTPSNTQPIAAVIDQEDERILRLVFEDKFTANTNYTLSWDTLPNTYNQLFPSYQVDFIKDETPPRVLELAPTSDKMLKITFSEPLNETTATIPANFSLTDPDVHPIKADYQNSSVSITLFFEETFQDKKTYTLSLKNIKDKTGNAMPPTQATFTYQAPYRPQSGELIITEIMADPTPSRGLPAVEYIEIYNTSNETIQLSQVLLSDFNSRTSLTEKALSPGQYTILTSTTNVSTFPQGQAMGIPNFPSLGNSSDSLALSLADNTLLDAVHYTDDWYRDATKADGGYSLERLQTHEKCTPALNWIASAAITGGTPGSQNSLWDTEPDQTEPEVTSLTFTGTATLQVTFNEPMNAESLAKSAFRIEGGLGIKTVHITSLKEAEIELTQIPEKGQMYTLHIEGVSDCAGNPIAPYTYTFGMGETPKFNELLITELMADPDPEVGLPQTEYLELYNASSKNLELGGLTLHDESKQTLLPDYILPPDTHLVLLPSGSTHLFADVNTLAVPNWLSLANSGELLSLYNDGELIFSLQYDLSWYKNAEKANGGWSLEMIDKNNPCGEGSNWTASTSTQGGTPGLVNASSTSNPDNTGPGLSQAMVVNSHQIKLIFDEKLHPNLVSQTKITIDPPIPMGKTEWEAPLYKTGLITFNEEIQLTTPYTITVTGVNDCVKNLENQQRNTAVAIRPEAGNPGDIIINEILFNPESGGVDFVELYNRSDKVINLKKWLLANDTKSATIATQELLIHPKAFLVLTPDPTVLKADYPRGDESTFVEVPSFPSYPDTEGTVQILDSLEQVIDAFDYHEDFHLSLLSQVDGVSLERISFDAPAQTPDSWQSAASTAGFATPGLMNSQFAPHGQSKGTVTIEPKVFTPDNTGINDFTTIRYDLTNPGNFANVYVYDPVGRLIKTLAEGAPLATSGFYTWDGTNNHRARVRPGYYTVYFELYDSLGNKEIIKKTVVLGVRF